MSMRSKSCVCAFAMTALFAPCAHATVQADSRPAGSQQQSLDDLLSSGDYAGAHRAATKLLADRSVDGAKRARAESVLAISAVRVSEQGAAAKVSAAIRAAGQGPNADLLPQLYLALGITQLEEVARVDQDKASIPQRVALAQYTLRKATQMFEDRGLGNSPDALLARANLLWAKAWLSDEGHAAALAALKRLDASNMRSDDPGRPYITYRLADLLFRENRELALARLDAAIALTERTRPADPVIAGLYAVASAGAQGTDPRRAIQYRRKAIAFWRSVGVAGAALDAYFDLAILLDDVGQGGLGSEVDEWMKLAGDTHGRSSEAYFAELDRMRVFIDEHDREEALAKAKVLREMIRIVEKNPDKRDKLREYGKELAQVLGRSDDEDDEAIASSADPGAHLSARLSKLDRELGEAPAKTEPGWKTQLQGLEATRRYAEAAELLNRVSGRREAGNDPNGRLEAATRLVELNLWYLRDERSDANDRAIQAADAGIAEAAKLGGGKDAEAVSLGFAKAAALLFAGRAEEADRQLAIAVAGWRRAIGTHASDATPPDLRPANILFRASNAVPSLRTMPPSVTRDVLAVSGALDDDASKIAGVLASAASDPRAHGAIDRKVRLLTEASNGSPRQFSKGLDGLLRIIGESDHATFLRGLKQRLGSDPSAIGKRLRIEIELLKVYTRPSRPVFAGSSAWPKLAEALAAAGDLAGARALLARAPIEMKPGLALTIAEATKSAEDFQVALGLARGMTNDEKVDALSRLGKLARTQQLGDWRSILRQSPEPWRDADELLAGGDVPGAMELIKSAPEKDRSRLLHWVISDWAEYSAGVRSQLSTQLLPFMERLSVPTDRASVFRYFAEKAWPDQKSLGLSLAKASADAIRAGQSICQSPCTAVAIAIDELAELYARWGLLDEAFAIVDLLRPDQRVRQTLELAAEHPAGRERIFARAALLAERLDRAEGADAFEQLADAEAEVGDQAALRHLRLSQALKGPDRYREQQQLKIAIVSARLGDVRSASQSLESLNSPADRAQLQAYIAEQAVKGGSDSELERVMTHLITMLHQADEDSREYPRSIAERVIVRSLAKAGKPLAIEYAIRLGGDLRDVGYILDDLFEAAPSRQIVLDAALRALAKLPPEKAKQSDRIYFARQLADAGFKSEAMKVLADVQLSAGSPSAAVRNGSDNEIGESLATMGELASGAPKEEAGDLALSLSFLEEQVARRNELNRHRLLETASRIAARDEGSSYVKDKLRLRLAELEHRVVDPKKELRDQLAKVAPPSGTSSAGTAALEYYRVASSAAGKSDTLDIALTAARQATEAHWRWVKALFDVGASTSAVRRDRSRKDSDQIYFLHLSLLARAMGNAPNREQLLAEAFQVAQRMSFGSLDVEAVVGGRATLKQLRRLQAEFARAKQDGLDGRAAELKEQVEQKRNELDDLTRAATRTVDARIPSLRAVQRGLAKGQLILFYALEHGLQAQKILDREPPALVFVITATSAEMVSLGSESWAVDDRVAKFAAAMRLKAWNTRAAEFEDTASAPETSTLPFDTTEAFGLYDLLLAPALKNASGINELMVVSDPSISRIPLSLLLTSLPSDGASQDLKRLDWLSNRLTISELPTLFQTASRVPLSAARPSRPFLGFGDPDLQRAAALRPARQSILDRLGRPDADELSTLRQLPDTAVELNLSSAALRAQPRTGEACVVCTGQQATERRVRQLSSSGELRDYRVISFATHGLLAGEVSGLSEPALVLTPGASDSAEDDGLLTASEVATLDLNADLVILSACNTAVVGEQRDVSSLSDLARAFLDAGARAVLISHWPVDSAATAHLAAALATAMPRSRGDYAAALRSAMRDMIANEKQPRWAHPYFWAPFTLVRTGPSNAAH